MSYRPITDTWILARPKVRYYGSYPSGFLERARALLGVRLQDPVLHVCSGKVRDYPFRGLGPNDRTVDLDVRLKPDYVIDVSKESLPQGYAAILADPPYTVDDAEHYGAASVFPTSTRLLAACLAAVKPGGRVGMLHYEWPRPPRVVGGWPVRSVAAIGVLVGFGNRIRCFSVYERASA